MPSVCRIGVLAAVGSLISTTVVAQGHPTVPIGLQAGFVFSRFGGADVQNPKVQFGFAAGVSMSLGLGRYLAIRPELLYAEKGVRFSGDDGSSSLKMSYLELPALLVIRIPGIGRLTPEIYGGGAVGLRADCRQNITSGNTSLDQTCGSDVEPAPRRFDTSLVVGAGAEVERIRFGVRFAWGLTRLDPSDERLDIRNRALYLMAGTVFR
ncbi:MAG: porin family protein [Gemmatimonadales bacterium]